MNNNTNLKVYFEPKIITYKNKERAIYTTVYNCCNNHVGYKNACYFATFN